MAKNNLKTDGWFAYYRGRIYRNKPLSIHHTINNKILIDREHERGVVASLSEIQQRHENAGWSEKHSLTF